MHIIAFFSTTLSLYRFNITTVDYSYIYIGRGYSITLFLINIHIYWGFIKPFDALKFQIINIYIYVIYGSYTITLTCAYANSVKTKPSMFIFVASSGTVGNCGKN